MERMENQHRRNDQEVDVVQHAYMVTGDRAAAEIWKIDQAHSAPQPLFMLRVRYVQPDGIEDREWLLPDLIAVLVAAETRMRELAGGSVPRVNCITLARVPEGRLWS